MGCEKCGQQATGLSSEARNDFDDELEKGLQARLLFQKEEWRQELKQELFHEVSDLKNVAILIQANQESARGENGTSPKKCELVAEEPPVAGPGARAHPVFGRRTDVK